MAIALPKIVAIGSFTLVPWGMAPNQILFLVAGAMALGSLVAGIRVARRLGDDIVELDHVEGAPGPSPLAAGLVAAAVYALA